jgi:hypothetical protein
MIINYRDKYTDFKLFFLKKKLKIMHIFNKKLTLKYFAGVHFHLRLQGVNYKL